ncbi:FtsB family cell division protein [Fulvivirga sedimenti]|uniref:Septum formation initiator family protein n=1 Tax=Fulvivirga sedimenti TaxID=2879465 RepID=A0A9X1HLN8_9BACT|nr:septum formation initiator family protein [Fulvivirga sedimenti]MCA6074181.1 septum formation initiator family protein [Fulvivirga sedimenti]
MKIPPITRNFYFLATAFFMIWMLFIDNNDFITQISLRQKLSNLEDEKTYYQEKINEVKEEREELLSNDELLEKFAREKYYMKKKTEDVFVIVEE